MTSHPPEQPPPGWKADKLSQFLADADRNQYATFANLTGSYARLRDIDGIYEHLANNLDNPPDWIAAFFVYRAHAAYRAAVRLGISGQIPDLYPVLRSCLENALYSLHFNRHPKTFQVWRRRDESPEAAKRVKADFQVKKVMSSLAAADMNLHHRAERLYEDLIDLGAHPNQLGVFSNLQINETPEAVTISTIYLMGDSNQLRLALKRCAHVGVVAFDIIRLVFKERCDLLQLTPKLATLRKGL